MFLRRALVFAFILEAEGLELVGTVAKLGFDLGFVREDVVVKGLLGGDLVVAGGVGGDFGWY